MGLAIGGIFLDPLDLVDAAVSAARGNLGDAALGVVTAVPLLGIAAGIARIGKKAERVGSFFSCVSKGEPTSTLSLFRQGKFQEGLWPGNYIKGKQWSLENPLTTKNYSAKYGLPAENSNPNWIIRGSYKGSYNTRVAPPSYNSPVNTGGGMEIVPLDNDNVRLDWFNMP